MIIDSHIHVILPLEDMIETLAQAGIDRAILFPTVVHPERATDLWSLDQELGVLNRILAGQVSSTEAYDKAMTELVDAVGRNPDKFYGFGRVPLGLSME